MKFMFKKSLSLLLVLCMLFSIFTTASIVTTAADAAATTPTVEIVSFMRGSQKDLRSSELLEARVTGYDGNVRELTYKWENTLGTYLYVYNSHNMYYIDGTDGEAEIYNSKIPASNNMAGRTYKDSFTGEGFCWAAIYGSNTSGQGKSIDDHNAYNGTIKVTVYDKDGNEIASDSHTGTVTSTGYLWWKEYQYSGIVDFNLQNDIDNVTIGLFEGDTRNVKDLLGESAIVHITCVESSVTKGTIISGSDKISLTQDGDYYITGTKAGNSTDSNGDAKVQLTVSKNQCKFHEQVSGTATTTVYVFKKPTTSTTAYTLTLTGNIDSRCRYFIYGREGVMQDDGTILFDGLTPNTEYPVEVRAEYKDENNNTRYTYAYVYDTTKPIYNGTVEVYLDGTYDSATHTASGTKVNLEDVSQYSTVYAKEVNSTQFVELKKVENETGTYTSILDSGSYKLYYTTHESSKIDDQLLTMHDADRTRYLFYNSVTYIDGDTELKKEYHTTGTSVSVWDQPMTKADYVFTGWKDQDGNVYQSASALTDSIGKPYVLTAQWEKGIDVYVNLTINHIATNNGHNIDDSDRHNVAFDLMSKPEGSDGNYADVFDAPITLNWNGSDYFSHDTFNASHVDTGEGDKTYYTAKVPVLSDVLEGNTYSVEISKTYYEIVSVTSTTAQNGDVIVDVEIRYDPKNADLTFSVELDEQSKELVKKHPEYKPSAVHVKVLSWYAKGYNEIQANTWEHISQHHDTFVTLHLDENGTATGSYPVWMHNSKKTEYYHYRIKVVSYVLADGTVIYTEDVAGKENVEYLTTDDRYLATIYVTDGNNPAPQYTSLTGAHFNNNQNTQQGDIKGVIHINTYDVTFEPDGGKFDDGTTDSKTAQKQIEVPNLSEYNVTKDGGYVFDGWYLVDKNGKITDKTVNSADTLLSDITLRAKWKAPLTVEGSIFVAGYYHLNDNENDVHVILENDRAHSVTIFLQKLLPNGYAETVLSQKVDVTYDDADGKVAEKPIGTATYKFVGVPDDGYSYRVLLSNPNYSVTYQNEDDSLDESKIKNFDIYNNVDFSADFGIVEPLVADVNAFMEFEPHDFALHYQVKATTIGAGLRPSNTEVLVLYDDGSNGNHPQDWAVISQMIQGETIKGQDTALDASGIGNNSYDVWRNKTDGHSLYSYGVLLNNYTINGVETTYNAESAPFYVYYNGSARYSALEGLDPEHQTQLLTIELQPKRYTVTFDINFSETKEDYVENMDYYRVQTDDGYTYLTGHLWSYDTDISNVVPLRHGYKFLGWYDENDNLVTNIDASVHENVTVYAKWEEAFKVTFHSNNPDIKNDVFRTYYENGSVIPELGSSFELNSDATLDSFYDIPQFEYLTHNNYVFKGWYLDKDNDSRPINWSETYTEDTDVYAHWILVEDVNKDANDTKKYDNSGKYKGYDLLGVQIRDIEAESDTHYGEEGTGLRFVTALSENVYSQINALSSNNASGAEYGYVVAKTATAKKYAGDKEGYTLQYKGNNVNGVNTTTDYKYVQNMKCSGVVDHFNGSEYRLYTAVITYKNLDESALASAHAQELVARSYIRYTDANGLFRTHYNNYTGTNVYSGCSASFDLAKSLMNG